MRTRGLKNSRLATLTTVMMKSTGAAALAMVVVDMAVADMVVVTDTVAVVDMAADMVVVAASDMEAVTEWMIIESALGGSTSSSSSKYTCFHCR